MKFEELKVIVNNVFNSPKYNMKVLVCVRFPDGHKFMIPADGFNSYADAFVLNADVRDDMVESNKNKENK